MTLNVPLIIIIVNLVRWLTLTMQNDGKKTERDVVSVVILNLCLIL